MVHGHPWSKDVCNLVIHASKLEVGHMVTEAITSVSKQGIQRIASESRSSNNHHQRHQCKKLLDNGHWDVSWVSKEPQ